MTYFIAYDIADSKRLRKVSKILQNFGMRVQYSFFQCDISIDILNELKKELLAVIEKKEDSLHIYPLCEDCLKLTETMGTGDISVNLSYQIL